MGGVCWGQNGTLLATHGAATHTPLCLCGPQRRGPSVSQVGDRGWPRVTHGRGAGPSRSRAPVAEGLCREHVAMGCEGERSGAWPGGGEMGSR